MPTGQSQRRPSFIGLCSILVLVTVVFGVRATYTPFVYYAVAGFQVTMICVTAWTLGARGIKAKEEERRKLAIAGSLLIAPWALFSLLAGFGPPWQATATENEFRYLVLLISTTAVTGGLIFLKELLNEAGERFYSTLGFAAILLASPFYLIWAAMLLYEWAAKQRADSVPLPPGLDTLSAMSDYLLFFGGALTYIAAGAFATSLGRASWLGHVASRTFVTVSSFALLCLAVRGPKFPDPTGALTHWYDIPGFVVGIPAIPWLIPLMFGVVLLRRAGSEQR